MEVPKFVYSKKIGEPLKISERNQLFKFISQLYSDALPNRRYKRLAMPEHMIQSLVYQYFSNLGYKTRYEVSLKVKDLTEQKIIFDVIAEHKKEKYFIEVKDKITSRDIGQVLGYSIALKLNKIKGKIYLCTDIVSLPSLTKTVTKIMLKELMENEDVGLILLDKTYLILFHNYAQLDLKEMPQFLFL